MKHKAWYAAWLLFLLVLLGLGAWLVAEVALGGLPGAQETPSPLSDWLRGLWPGVTRA